MIAEARNAREAAEQCYEVMCIERGDRLAFDFLRALRLNALDLADDEGLHSDAFCRFFNRTRMLTRRRRKATDVAKTVAILDELDRLAASSPDPDGMISSALTYISDGPRRDYGRVETLIDALSNRKTFDAVTKTVTEA